MEIRNQLRFFSRTITLATVAVLLSSSLFAQNRSTISGYVFTSDRSPVAQIPVELRNDVNGVIGRTRTDGTGRFVFFRVPNGRLSVTVIPIGTNLEEQSREVEIAGMGARGLPIPENVQVDFHLRVRKGSTQTAGCEVVFAQ